MTALANASRLQILTILIDREVAVGPLSLLMNLSPSALSQHLAKLRAVNLVSFRRHKQTVYYRCESSTAKAILATLTAFFDPDAPVISGTA